MAITIQEIQRVQNLKRWIASIESAAGGDKAKAGALMEERVLGLMKENKLDPRNFNFTAAFEATVNSEGTLNLADQKAVNTAIESSMFPKITQPMVAAVVKEDYEGEVGDLLSLFREEDAKHSMKEDLVNLNTYGQLQYRKYGGRFERTKPIDESFTVWYRDYGTIIDLHMEDLMDDTNNLLIQRISDGAVAQGRKLAEVLAQTLEMGSTRYAFDEAANTAYTRNGVSYTGNGAGSSTAKFYATDTHTLIDGQTNINSISTAFSSDGVKEGTKLLAKMTDPRGNKIRVVPRVIVSHSTMWQDVAEFLGSDKVYDAIEQTTNVWKGKLRPVASPYFSSETRYWLGDVNRVGRVRWVERPSTERRSGMTDDAFEARIVLSYRHAMYLGAMLTDYRTIISCAS